MLEIECTGSPYEIGHLHGHHARALIAHSLAFYAALFTRTCALTWPEVLAHAAPFEAAARARWPAYYDEMRGIADGAGVGLAEVVALNCRSEIVFGVGAGRGEGGTKGDGGEMGEGFLDGCTALAWRMERRVWLAQNWDWLPAQAPALILLRINQPSKPTILQITEAGILGKIGFNSAHVGVCLNAIRCPGVAPAKLPVHFALRAALECRSAADAVALLEAHGVASSAHILVADAEGAVGVESTCASMARCELDQGGRVVHTNHLLSAHEGGAKDTVWLADSVPRLERMKRDCEVLGQRVGKEPGLEDVQRLFESEEGAPVGICRGDGESGGSETLFNVVMELGKGRGWVRLGKPGKGGEEVVMEL